MLINMFYSLSIFQNFRNVFVVAMTIQFCRKIWIIIWLSEHVWSQKVNLNGHNATSRRYNNATDTKEFTVGVVINFIRSFDTIDYGMMLNKLEKYGVGQIAYSLAISHMD